LNGDKITFCVAFYCVILTDKRNSPDIMYWSLFSTAICFCCLRQPSSGRRGFI